MTSEVNVIYSNLIGATATQYGAYQNTGISSSQSDLINQRNTVISIMWSLYSIMLIGAGFFARIRIVRILGLCFFFITALKVLVDVWSLGELYRIIASITFGAIALFGSFIYVKYSARIKEMIYE